LNSKTSLIGFGKLIIDLKIFRGGPLEGIFISKVDGFFIRKFYDEIHA